MSYIRRKNKMCSLCRKEIYSNEPQINLAGMFYHKPCPKNKDKSEDKSEDKSKIQVNNNIINTRIRSSILQTNNYNNDEEYNYTTNTKNRDHNPYRDWNHYDDDNDYQQDFYHRFFDPWKVRNDVENNGYIVTNYGEVFSPEQVKYYEKLGHSITPDSNIHG
jgi:hypothetical protein